MKYFNWKTPYLFILFLQGYFSYEYILMWKCLPKLLFYFLRFAFFVNKIVRKRMFFNSHYCKNIIVQRPTINYWSEISQSKVYHIFIHNAYLTDFKVFYKIWILEFWNKLHQTSEYFYVLKSIEFLCILCLCYTFVIMTLEQCLILQNV